MTLRHKFTEAPFLKSFHGWMAVQWAAHIPVVVFFYFVFPETWDTVSILYLALVSIYANVVGHWSTWQASRAEIAVEKQNED